MALDPVFLNLVASDVSGQHSVQLPSVPADATIGELVRRLLARMGLVRTDAHGRPMVYRARLEREGRQLHGSELVRDALQPEDRVVLQPHIQAG